MGSTENEALPYWQMNVPFDERPTECPPFLQNLGEKDVDILRTPDSEYHILSWPEVRKIIADGRIDLFQRVPSDLRRYMAYNYKVKQEYGSVMQFVLTHKLGWTLPIEPSAPPFKNPKDVSVKWNDWPYGIDKKIKHLVVWTKFALDEDPKTDRLSEKTRKEIDDYVNETFCSKLGKENVIWFKNWKALKSVHSVEHFHVMLYNPDPEFLEEITGGDTPISQMV